MMYANEGIDLLLSIKNDFETVKSCMEQIFYIEHKEDKEHKENKVKDLKGLHTQLQKLGETLVRMQANVNRLRDAIKK